MRREYALLGLLALLGIVLLGEQLTPLVATGLGVIIPGVALINFRAGRT